jgi:hypothetical protein
MTGYSKNRLNAPEELLFQEQSTILLNRTERAKVMETTTEPGPRNKD